MCSFAEYETEGIKKQRNLLEILKSTQYNRRGFTKISMATRSLEEKNEKDLGVREKHRTEIYELNGLLKKIYLKLGFC